MGREGPGGEDEGRARSRAGKNADDKRLVLMCRHGVMVCLYAQVVLHLYLYFATR